METITRGGLGLTRIALPEGVEIAVRAPGLHVAWRTLEQAPPSLSEAETESGGAWQEALEANDLQLFAAVEAQPLAVEIAEVPALGMPDSPDTYAEMRATPPPGEGLLLMVESDGVVQWYLPTSATFQTFNALETVGAEPPAELRFQVPRSTLMQSVAIEGAGEGIFSAIGGAVVRFFRFPLVKALIGAAVGAVVKWIIDNIESKHKKEGFRSFNRQNNFPLLPKAALDAMSGQRVLLLTHGIFSSLEGAFNGISDEASPVLQHLRSVYHDRIIGWDHWTVAKTPLENATDMLAAMPAGFRPDIVCHSRGGLVTRAVLEHPSLEATRKALFASVGKAVFIAGANQGSQLAMLPNLNRLLNIYAAVGSIPILGAAGVVLKVIVGLLKVLAQVATRLPSIAALSTDESKNPFLKALNGPTLTPTGEIVVAHANYDPSKGLLAKFLDLNVDKIFNAANDMVVPYTGAEVFDKWQHVGTNINYGTATKTQGVVMHTNFFFQPGIHALLASELV